MPKTGEHLWEFIKDDIQLAQDLYSFRVIQVATDNGPDCRKMRRLGKKELPWIGWLECWAHQIHLMTGNFLAISTDYMDAVSDANELIKWWNNHSYALAELWQHQLALNFSSLLVFLVAVTTRWLSNFCSLNRVLRLETAVRGCVLVAREKLRLAGGASAAAQEKAEQILAICARESFWADLKR